LAFVVLKRYNDTAPATMTLLTARAPFLHNSDARISGALERPGPVVEIWQIDGPGS
jgi:hypothetical protein